MATKYGQEAIAYWERLKAKRATQKKTLAIVIAVVVIWLVLEYRVFG